ncbi:Beta-N-acetylhexosaminidase [Candidatus Sulfotelmatobacter kueseliae]|uniref:Beta-N-acetylhexosaminidase n=1 Tax=Candidatus Sulfotelmatobacter kueseliae TaxID=2042962 RepID=A0A2U3L7K8_9BACT|nr:Beta-N-acetylhexosaminidase [Candidatus Sulfotelmatobacter kueseliae]
MKLMRSSFLVSLFFSLMSVGMAQSQPQLNLMPMPASVQPGAGQFAISQSFSVAVTGFHDAALDREVQRFQTQLSRQTGIPFRPKPGASPALEIHAGHGREAVQKLGEDESYELTITDSAAKLTAPAPLGVLRGLQTFLQLVEITPTGFAVPAVTIKDQPRFAWRGLMFDVSRHFIPVDVLKRNLDGMAAVKMNVMHWHLSDDQGFRAESKVFPKLHEMGSAGQFYTQDEMRDIIAYAHDRGIRVIPEFDMPGHSTAWFVGHPELASAPGPYKLERRGGIFDATMDPTREETYKFLEKFIAEMTRLFPDAYFHIGGDEVNGKQWDSNPKIQAFIHAHGMKNNQDLQAYFNQRLQKIVARNHKLMVGWDEILNPDLPKTIVIQSWRGQDSLAAAAKQGYSGLLSYGYYLDLMWSASRHYAIDPMSDAAATLSPEEKSRILGGESCQWAEWVTPENVDSHIWPRNAVIAERLWSPQNVTDVASMYARMNAVSLDLEWLGLTHRSARMHMLHRMAGPADISALRVLADVVEPVKDYGRGDDTSAPDFDAPLTYMIDAVYPESDTARQFSGLVQTFLQSGAKDPATEAQIRSQLTTWRDNDAKLHPLLEQSSLLQEDEPLSQNLSALGAAGLQALDYLDQSQPAPDAWKSQQLALVEQAKKPGPAGLLLMVAAPVGQLIDGSGGAKSTP